MLYFRSPDALLAAPKISNQSYSGCPTPGIDLEGNRLGIPSSSILENDRKRETAKDRRLPFIQELLRSGRMAWHQRLPFAIKHEYPLHAFLKRCPVTGTFPLSRIKFASTMFDGLVVHGTPTYTLSLLMPHDSRYGLATHP